MRIEINKCIIADSKICGGTPTFKGTRIMVHSVLELLEAGESFKDIIKAYPSLTEKHIKAALHYAADITRGGNIVIVPLGD